MMMKNAIIFMLTFMIGIIAQSSFAQAKGKPLDSWKLLSSRVVDSTIERDVVALNSYKTSITDLKLVVKNGSVNMYRASIDFANGDTQYIDFADRVNAASDGHVLELTGNARPIENVTIWYNTKNGVIAKATVEVWGK